MMGDDKSINQYRLGDLYMGLMRPAEWCKLRSEYPDSIGARYIKNLPPHILPFKRSSVRNNQCELVEIMTKVILEFTSECNLPDEIKNSNVVHLRLGDVVAGTQNHEKVKRPFPVEYFSNLSLENRKTFIVGKPHFGFGSSENRRECLEKSEKYLMEIKEALSAEHFDGGSADVDLCAMVNAEYFIQGRGAFSLIASQCRDFLERETHPCRWRT